MAIRDVLVPELLARFGDHMPVLGTAPDPIATFPAAHPDVGEIVIWDDGDEVTVEIGSLAHDHFPGQSPREMAWHQEASAAVLDLLDRAFADRILLWTHRPGCCGGWCDLGYERNSSE